MKLIDKDALVEGAAFFHLILIDKNDAVAEAQREFLALAQQPAGRSTPLGVFIVRTVVGQHHRKAHQPQQRGKHTRADIVDVHHIRAVEQDVQHTQQGVPHGLKALDAR